MTKLRDTRRVSGSIAWAIAVALTVVDSYAQVGQTALDPSGGVINRAVVSSGLPSGTNPGWLYYGVNAADRGLGYNGSYMTVGGFFPAVEDDLGGLWAADLRGHLSQYGGFFSNAGLIRKQFVGGTLLGVGVYWDYDGDQNQYPTMGMPGTSQFGQFGQAYNQVGVSGEWLTDFGSLRSNGYIPVGTTAIAAGAPGSPFTANYLLCNYGFDAALGGADLEIGAYVPGLADWAGMVSVGGYALGNARYDWAVGSQLGQPVVPWFGGVYTRLDMTFLENWDFSLQANNDSYFDWTGFARLTYRMGGSRRRNVPDQVEQPMMRNEHIVRGHQTPVVAINPETGSPWRVIHVDSAAAFGGNGTAQSPVQTLAQAQALATNPYDVVFVHTGNSSTTPYASSWQFQADNQILVGQGSTLQLNTASCGYRQFFNSVSSTSYPILTSSGTAITLRDGAIVDHLRIQDAAQVAVAATNSLTTVADVNDVHAVGTNAAGQVGMQVNNVVGGTVNFYGGSLENTRTGLAINGSTPSVTFQGRILQESSSGQSLLVQNLTGGTINVNRTNNTLATAVARNSVSAKPHGIEDLNSLAATAIDISSNANAVINVGPTMITTPTQVGASVQNNLLGATAISLNDFTVINSGSSALLTAGNSAATTITVAGASSISSAATASAAIATNDAAQLFMTLRTVGSAVPATSGTAIELLGTSNGFLTVGTFTVGGAPGNAGNVQNGTGVTVTLPP